MAAALERDADGKPKVDVMVALVGLVLMLMICMIPVLFSMKGTLATLEERSLSLEGKLAALQIPPPWLKDQVDKQGTELRTLSDKVTTHVAEDGAKWDILTKANP